MGSKQSHAPKVTIPPQTTHQPIVKDDRYLILGTASVGKSIFNYCTNRILNHQHYNNEEFNDVNITSWMMIMNLWMIFEESERRQLMESFPKEFDLDLEKTRREIIQDKYLGVWRENKILVDKYDFSEVLMCLWNSSYFRELFERRWNEISPNIVKYVNSHNLQSISLYIQLNFSILDNLEEFVSKIESRCEFFPLAYSYQISTGPIEFQIRNLYIRDVGGCRNERKKWLCSFNYQSTLILMISLAELDQFLVEDENMLRIQESKRLFDELNGSSFFKNARKIVIFTKPDILIKKLQSGISNNLKNYDIRPELEGISDFNIRNVVNSIISHHFSDKNECQNIHSFHIVNLLEVEEIRQVVNRIIDWNSKDTAPFISSCLLNGMKFKTNSVSKFKETLHVNSLKGNFTDIKCITYL